VADGEAAAERVPGDEHVAEAFGGVAPVKERGR